jgi:Ca2+/H+ antiporter
MTSYGLRAVSTGCAPLGAYTLATKGTLMANAPATTPGNALALLTRSQRIILTVAIGLSVLAGVLTPVIVFDGESNWLEGLALIGLYVIIAAVSFWWG